MGYVHRVGATRRTTIGEMKRESHSWASEENNRTFGKAKRRTP